MTRALHSILALGFVALAACGGGSSGEALPDGGIATDGGQQLPDAPPSVDAPDDPINESCPSSVLGTNDGCDCGCGVVDPDCSSAAASACEYNNCPPGSTLDTQTPTQCVPIVVPSGWTCDAGSYGDGTCHCGCGVPDSDCPSSQSITSCSATNGCGAGKWPDPANPSVCINKPAGWTCSVQDWADSTCSCGCGVPDPSCPSNPHISQCLDDGCPSGKSPDPTHPTACISNAPQDRWTCNLALLADGSTCDCGCGAVDPDCGTGATAASCDSVACGTKEELKPGNLGVCWESCHANEPANSGSATCTNGGYFAVGSLACTRDASACSDGHRYEIECEGGDCSCRIDGACVGHASTTGCGFSACGWSVFGPN